MTSQVELIEELELRWQQVFMGLSFDADKELEIIRSNSRNSDESLNNWLKKIVSKPAEKTDIYSTTENNLVNVDFESYRSSRKVCSFLRLAAATELDDLGKIPENILYSQCGRFSLSFLNLQDNKIACQVVLQGYPDERFFDSHYLLKSSSGNVLCNPFVFGESMVAVVELNSGECMKGDLDNICLEALED